MIEIDELIQFGGHHDGSLKAWCPSCRSDAWMVTPLQAATIARVTVRAVNQQVEAGLIHFLETRDGALLVCVNSLE